MVPLFLLLLLSYVAADFCPKDTVTDQSRLKCYKFFKTRRPYNDAKAFCQEIGGDMAALPNETILVEQIKEHARLDKCYFWSTSLQSKKCVLVLNWKYREEIKDCSVPASFLCEFEPRCECNVCIFKIEYV
ncbi:hypothetical protein QR680_018618 [Steinernema hermaphroditum]|uniref:C-type lectin domain-containing protein n=1 Tax=Steinernema hermaphroditum TaxID=289476 RepID=A0AA39HKM8_9BILA|nr:hypothetical protein QR680_018618 [Steinernema hermaphroditum]